MMMMMMMMLKNIDIKVLRWGVKSSMGKTTYSQLQQVFDAKLKCSTMLTLQVINSVKHLVSCWRDALLIQVIQYYEKAAAQRKVFFYP